MNSKKAFTVFKCVIIVVGVIVIPMLYSYFYLDAFWDPYNRLNTLPVALVNQDQGAVINNQSRNLGSEMVKELKDDGTLKWIQTSEADAGDGVESGKYYARIIIPADFSKDVASSATTQKIIAHLDYSVNQKKNYVAAQLLGKATQTIQLKTDSKINQDITQELTNKLNQIPKQLGDLSDGLDKIRDGTVTLKSGADTLTSGTASLKAGASSLTQGTRQLSGGIQSLDTGLTALKTGAQSLFTNLVSLDQGLGSALDGANRLAAGAAAIPQLNSGIAQLNTAASALNTQMNPSANGTATLYDNVNYLNTQMNAYSRSVNSIVQTLKGDTAISEKIFTELSAQLSALQASNPADTADMQALYTARALYTNLADTNETMYLSAADIAQTTAIQQQFASAGTQLSGGTSSLLAQFGAGSASSPTLKYLVSGIAGGTASLASNEQNLTDMRNGINSLASGLAQAKSGSSQLVAGANQLQTGAGSAKDGSSALVSGAGSVSSGASQVSSGASQAADGASQLSGGAGSLSRGVSQAKDKVDSSLRDSESQLEATKGLDTFANTPMTIQEKDVYPVKNYGTSFAPYFLSLSLYVGALIMFFGIYLDPQSRLRALSRESNHKMIRIAAFVLIGIAQAILLSLILKYALHLQCKNTTGFFLSAMLVSVVFVSIIEFLVVHLKDLGKFLAIAFLVLQLTSCAGVFPMETVPALFNKLYPFMPMTYSVRVFKDVISGYTGSDITYNIAVLLVIFAAFTTLNILFSLTRRAGKHIKEKMAAQNA